MSTLERILTVALVIATIGYIGYVLALDSSERGRAKADILIDQQRVYIKQLETEKTEILRLVDILTPMQSPVLGLFKPRPKCIQRRSNGKCRKWK